MKAYKLLIISTILLLCCTTLAAQNESGYLQEINTCLLQNDCRKAQIWYDAYKNLTGKTDAAIEKRIADCKGNTQTTVKSPATTRHPAEPEMVTVQGGTFWMGCSNEQGSDCESDERPLHSVTLSDFSIAKYEVTQKQWQLIMGTTVRQQRDKANTSWAIYGEGDNYPMYYVSWEETQEFISRLNAATGKTYRLPTEAEWEYAARGGNKSQGYKYSGSHSANAVAWYHENSGSTNHPVGTKLPNELGIYDMSGSVWEWCFDWYGAYPASPQTNPKGATSGSSRVIRGGSWFNFALYVRVPARSGISPGFRDYNLGFRLASSSK
ncbi:hypothetical protein FACS18947_1580 [Bacteroidia bacterium]|nr:hypothetical protein FACS18947_1580 [Bacteroidia bacterium]